VKASRQIVQVALHYWLQVGVDDYGGGAFVFAEFGEDLVGDGEWEGEWLEGGGDSLFIFRICEREEEHDRDGFWVCGGDVFGDGAQFFLRRCSEDFAVAGGAFGHAEAEILRDQWFDAVEEEVVEFGAGLASDFDDVFEAGGGD
jgi:hypothetical protein